MVKAINIVGARPQFIKYFPVSKAFGLVEGFKEVLVHTGQHYDYSMSKIFFDEFGIKEPEYHLEAGSGHHGEQTALILKKSEEVFLKEKPDVVIVYGDTNSTIGAALAASKLHIPVAHIEAGLRSYDKRMPEEVNRVLTDHLSTLLFCPSGVAINNLRREGFSSALNDGRLVPVNFSGPLRADADNPLVMNVGDVMYDVLLEASTLAESRSTILGKLGLGRKDYAMLTAHRAESTDDAAKFGEIIEFVNRTSAGKTVVFPMHPRTKKVYEASGQKLSPSVRIIEPLGYFDIITLLKNAEYVMTDSGGMQKEAYWLRTPCITLRDRTEWVETVESGWNVLYRDYKGKHEIRQKDTFDYGDGKASERIVRAAAALCGTGSAAPL